MNLPAYSVNHRTVVLFTMLLLFVGGIYAYGKLGRLEDPEFTIKIATIVTLYPGASASEVELQVTDEIERAMQELEWLDQVRSVSKAGISVVYVDIQEQYRSRALPQIWDKLRRKVYDVMPRLPEGAMRPQINDDFGDVFGVFLAITGDGYSHAELYDRALYLQRELSLVKDVNRVKLWGQRQEQVIIEFSRSRMAELGMAPAQVVGAIQAQNRMVYSGNMDAGPERMRIDMAGDFQSLEQLRSLVLRGSPPHELVLLRDVAAVSRGYADPPAWQMRYNGKPAIGIGISTVSGGNVVEMGEAVKERLQEIMQEMPAGIDINAVAYQAQVVTHAIDQFVVNLLQSLAIVVGILVITMGLRSGLLIGWALALSIVGTLIIMLPLGIDLHRSSLGALIIAMGMLVDNAIVVTEGALIQLQQGKDRVAAAVAPAVQTAWPLLGATLVAAASFLPIYLAQNNTGEYCETIFLVVGISLGLSWVISMTATPVLSYLFLRVPAGKVGTNPYGSPFYRNYRFVLDLALRRRAATLAMMIGLLVLALFGFGYVEQMFFPDSDRTYFTIEHWLPEGSRQQEVTADLAHIEQYLLKRPEVMNVATCIGQGALRFTLEYEPQIPNSSLGVLIVNARSLEDMQRLIPEVEAWLHRRFPHAEPRMRPFPLGPFTEFRIEARFSGPDPVMLRELALKAREIMRADPHSKDTRDNWRQRVKVLRPEYSQPRGRRAQISRSDAAMALGMMTDGLPVGTYREDDELLPLVVRTPRQERYDVDNLDLMPVRGAAAASVPLGQVVPEFRTVWEDPIIHRYNRRRTITAQTQPIDGVTSDTLFQRLRPQIEAIALPPGYSLEWGGDYEQEQESNEALGEQMPAAFVLMAFVVVALFNAFRQPLIIVLTLPLSIIGVTVGLLVFDKPFGFMALLGLLSLFGMLIKNSVVLLDQIEMEIASGMPRYRAVTSSAVSRMRPVLMASFTTVLGMIPLLSDRLFGPMAVTIMSGLSFATVLTLIVVPVLYTLFFRISPDEQ